VPAYVEDQISPGLEDVQGPESPEHYKPGMATGPRSAKFDFLLQEDQNQPENPSQFILDLAGGDQELEQENKKARKSKIAAAKQERELKKA